MEVLRIDIDEEADVAYLRLRSAGVRKTVGEPPLLVDVDEQGNPVGVEMFGYSRLSMKDVAAALERACPASVTHAGA
ncbi:MAG TPA: DUF2283 domain-containing protein [Candidatus Xenobia bacterium]|jgi:uncharacterized protein YuzE